MAACWSTDKLLILWACFSAEVLAYGLAIAFGAFTPLFLEEFSVNYAQASLVLSLSQSLPRFASNNYRIIESIIFLQLQFEFHFRFALCFFDQILWLSLCCFNKWTCLFHRLHWIKL